MSDKKCRWDYCDDDQFEDWYYCEHHARALDSMNHMIAETFGGVR